MPNTRANLAGAARSAYGLGKAITPNQTGRPPLRPDTRSALITQDSVRTAKLKEPKLTVEQFKVPDYQMTKEMKALVAELRKKHSKIDDAFLALFEKRSMIFVEDGTDLKADCQCFPEDANGRPLEAKENASTVEETADHEAEERGLAAPARSTTGNAGWYAQRLAGSSLGESMVSKTL